MPMWPFLMGYCALCTALGFYLGRGAWIVPAILLGGYISARVLVGALEHPVLELSFFALWATVAILVASTGAHFTGAMFMLAAVLYPAFVTFGYRLEYMGLLPVLSDVLAIIGLLGVGGGLGVTYLDRGHEPRPGMAAAGSAGYVSGLAVLTVGRPKG
jgi:hypothetical protein